MRLYWLLAPMAVMVGACENNSATVAPRWTDEAIPATAPVPPVWFREDQVALGKTVYLDHCAECHGQLAEGDPNS
jgi:mono/diheme cytochrome c family protein